LLSCAAAANTQHTHQHATYTRPPAGTLLVAFSEELEAQHTKVAEQAAIVAELTREKEEQIRAHDIVAEL
jgi:GAF domain-containing protein